MNFIGSSLGSGDSLMIWVDGSAQPYHFRAWSCGGLVLQLSDTCVVSDNTSVVVARAD